MPCNGRAFDLIKMLVSLHCWDGLDPSGEQFWLLSAVKAAQNSWQTTLREKCKISLVTFSDLVILIVTCTKLKKRVQTEL